MILEEKELFIRPNSIKMLPKSFTITKKIAKQGKQAVIIIPTLLQEHLSPGTLEEIKIEIINQ